MTTENPAMHSGIRVLTEAQRRALIAKSFQAPTEQKAHPTVRIEILDREVAKELDPLLLNDTVPFWSMLDEPTIVHVGDREVLRLTPMPPETAPTANLSLDVYEAIVADLGTDDGGESSPDWTPQGLGAAREVLFQPPPGHGMPWLKGELEVRLRQAESVARWYGVTPDVIAKLTGRPYEARRSMLVAGGKSTSLTMALRRTSAETARIAEEARAAAEAERTPNARTLGDLGLAGVAVPLAEPEVQSPPSFARSGLTAVWIDAAGTHFFVWRTIVALALPVTEFVGCRTLRADEVIPAVPARRLEEVRDARREFYDMTVSLRRKFMPDVDRGPVREWRKDTIEAAKEIAARYAHEFYTPHHAMSWVERHVLELIVRGLQVRPDWAVAVLWEALLDTHARCTGEPRMVPRGLKRKAGSISPFANLRQRGEDPPKGMADLVRDTEWTPPGYPTERAVQKDMIERLAVEAAASGEVELGSLLPARDATSKKKHR